jgi:transposase
MQAAHMTFEEETLKSRAIIKRLTIENTNLKRSDDILRNKVLRLEKENIFLKRENHILKEKQLLLLEKQAQLEKQIESLQLIVEELRSMIFGKKSGNSNNTGGTSGSEKESAESSQEKSTQATKRKKAERSKASYRRSAPTEDLVTDTINHPLTHCPDCGTLLTKFKQVIRYIEDLANLTELAKLLKKIEKHIIGSGYCLKCKRRKTAKEISPQVSILGENVKKFVCYLSIVMRLSFEQIRCFLKDTADFAISDGEITACLDEQAEKLAPEKDRLLTKIRGAPGRHYDETGWNVQKDGLGNYAWISRPTIGEETIFLMGRSRGKGNAEELQGDVDNQVGISDDYAAYDNLFKDHQLCMGHPQRKLRDLHESKTLSSTNKAACTATYTTFSTLYANLEKTLSSGYQKDVWLQKRDEYSIRLKEIAAVRENDPQKLKTIKQSLAQNVQKYFTCLTQPGIPADNNKAERGLRHIVLKRKISYGSKSQKGADTMSILCSTLLSAWWNKPTNFFAAYNQMLVA